MLILWVLLLLLLLMLLKILLVFLLFVIHLRSLLARVYFLTIQVRSVSNIPTTSIGGLPWYLWWGNSCIVSALKMSAS